MELPAELLLSSPPSGLSPAQPIPLLGSFSKDSSYLQLLTKWV